MKLLLDQGLPSSAAQLLRDGGVAAVHVGECGLASATDEVILAVARRAGQVVVTLDADFHAVLALSGEAGPSVIRIRVEGLRGQALAALVQTVLEHCDQDLEKGSLVTVTEGHIRVRRLPMVGRRE